MLTRRIGFAGKLGWTSELGCFNSFVLAMWYKQCLERHAVLPVALSAHFEQWGWSLFEVFSFALWKKKLLAAWGPLAYEIRALSNELIETAFCVLCWDVSCYISEQTTWKDCMAVLVLSIDLCSWSSTNSKLWKATPKKTTV